MIFKALRKRLRSDNREGTQPHRERDPAKAAALCAEAERLASAGLMEDAADHYALAIAHDAQHAASWLGYGSLMREANRTDAAIKHLETAAALAPQSPAWIELARAFKQAGRTADAARAYERAIALSPDDPAAYVNLGLLCLAQLGDAPRAETLLRRAVALAPHSVEAQTNLGLALHDQARWDEALAHFDRLVASHPECAEYRWHRACERLSLGDFERGWQDYEARKARRDGWRAPPPFPEWDGTPLTQGALLVYAEQGLGDEVMFASCISDLLRTVPECVIECDQRLASLYERSFPSAIVQGVDRKSEDLSWLRKYPQISAQCAVGSLPRYFRASRERFQGGPYLVPDPVRVERWRQRVGGNRAEPAVGIAWRGGTYQTRSELRSTQLAAWSPILVHQPARFYALQRATSDELTAADVARDVLVQLDDVDGDLEELCAAMSVLDLVITVQGSVGHLAGALGRPVWVLLNASAEWRYLATGDRMPWYESARLFRQPRQREWGPVFAAVAEGFRPSAK